MSVTSGAGVKAEPNVVPMIDVMLVLLIIFMVVTNLITSGFQAEPPQGVNLKSHPEDDLDQVLGIDQRGQYYLNRQPISAEDLGPRLQEIYAVRTMDQILYIKADKTLEYGLILDAMDVASKHGVRVIGAITDQRPGTMSSVAGDEIATGTKTP
ncbi:MAG: biopolymer transporter ExbD [Gemmatimonadaceae bacterium]